MSHLDHQVQILSAKVATFGGSGGAMAGSVWAFMNANAPAIGVLFGMISLAVALIGFYYLRRNKNIEYQILQARLAATKKEIYD